MTHLKAVKPPRHTCGGFERGDGWAKISIQANDSQNWNKMPSLWPALVQIAASLFTVLLKWVSNDFN